MLLTAETLKNLSFGTILLRLVTAMLLGGLVGLERTRKNQPAGFRTFMIVSMGAALTMPGIAGIILTVGMAVDSNVIVFERIREELRLSETPRKAIHIGYDKALWTILDSNITTAVAAIVLMNFGSGPVKGFAITLLLGIIATVYTAFFVSKTIFELKVRINPDKISI